MDQPPSMPEQPKMPPPLPPGPSGRKATSFARRSGVVSICAALAASVPAIMLVVTLTSPAGGPWTPDRIILAAVTGLLILGGFILSILALIRNAHKDQEAIGPVWTGLILNGFLITFLVAGVPRIKEARERARTREAITKVSESVTSAKEGARRRLNGETNGPTAEQHLANMQRSWDDAAHSLKGEDALVAEATKAYLQRLQNLIRDYSAALQPILQPSAVDMSGITKKDELDARRMAVQNFLATNKKFMAFYEAGETPMKEELVRLNISQAMTDSTMKGFRESVKGWGTVLQIRQTDVRLGNAMLAMLDLLESNWGKWSYNKEKRLVVFEDESIRETYNGYVAELKSAAELQAKLQKQAANKL